MFFITTEACKNLHNMFDNKTIVIKIYTGTLSFTLVQFSGPNPGVIFCQVLRVTSQLAEFLMAVSQLEEFQMADSHMAEYIIICNKEINIIMFLLSVSIIFDLDLSLKDLLPRRRPH